jgi:hypothetical protein
LKYEDPSGNIAVLTILAIAWVVTEVALTLYDIYDTSKTLLDSEASDLEKSTAVGVAGFIGPGAGYNSIGKGIVRGGKKINSFFKGADKVNDFGKGAREASKNAFSKKIKDMSKILHREKKVTVDSFKEANALLKHNFPNAKRFKGAGPNSKKSGFDLFENYKGSAYHRDYLYDSKTGKIFNHINPSSHWDIPHIYLILINKLKK